MAILLILEALFLLVGAIVLWKRARPAPPSFRAPLGWMLLAVVGQAAVLIAADFYLESLSHVPAQFARQLPRALMIVWVMQFLRAFLLLLAMGAWFQIVKPALGRRRTGGAFLAGLALLQIPDSFAHVVGFLTVVIVLARMQWSGALHGLTRFCVLLGTVITLILLSIDVTALITPTGFDISVLIIGNPGDQSIIAGSVSGPGAAAYRLTGIWDRAIKIPIALLQLIAAVAFFKLLVIPVRMRGLSLARRFTMTFILFRIIPGLLGLAAALLIIYFGAGWQRARIAKMMFDDTLARNLMVAESILEKIAPFVERDAFESARPPYNEVRRWLGPDSTRAHFVVRRYGGSGAPGDAADPGAAGPGGPIRIGATPGTPPAVTAQPLFRPMDRDSTAGLIARDGRLYLAAGRMRPDRKASSEVYVAVDSLFLRRIMKQIAVDIKLEAKPSLFITATTISASNDSAWTDKAIALEVSEPRDSSGAGFLHDTHYLARTFLPVGNWLEQREEIPAGVISLTLKTSIDRILGKVADEPYFLSSNSIPIIMLVIILVLLLFAELSAVRTGQSIAKGILDDVKMLASATRQFGEGDFGHRIPVRGKDELSTLASSFNTMAEDIQEHQKVLLEKERLEADLAVAREIQQRMLPQEAPVVAGLDVGGISIPSREVGGDLFYFLTLPDGNLGFALGDVSGKSVPAALLMANTVAALRAETRFDATADHVLDQMNKLIADQVEPGKFVTFFYGIVDRAAGVIRYSCAGHNPPLKMNAAGASAWLSEAGLPLGVFPDAEYSSSAVPFNPGDIFVLYSDGVTEAERDPAAPRAVAEPAHDEGGGDEFFGEARLEGLVRQARHESADEIIESLLNAIRAYSGDALQSDDVTVIVIKRTDGG